MKERSEPEIRDTVRRLVFERVDEVPLDDSASLLATTNLDSLGVVGLLVAIEEAFDVSIDFVTVDPVSLLTISGLTRHLSGWTAAGKRRRTATWRILPCLRADIPFRSRRSTGSANPVKFETRVSLSQHRFGKPSGSRRWW